MRNEKVKIVFTGGGSGGHIFPLVAVARELRRIYAGNRLELHYVGPKDELADIYLRQEDFTIHTIVAGKIRRYFSFENIADIVFKIPFGFMQALFTVASIEPALVLSKGGTGSLQVTYAAKWLGTPVFVHESDAVPGRSNQKTAKWAKRVFVSYEKTRYFNQKSVTVTGNPIRAELMRGEKPRGAELFSLSMTKPVILIMGGSQGAEAINDFMLNSLSVLLPLYELIHVTGRNNFKSVEAESQFVADKDLLRYYHPVAFLDEDQTSHAYAVADLVVSRAGSGSIFEIAALGKPSILVPLPIAADQPVNAYEYSQTGAAVVMEQDNLTPNFFLENLQIMFLNEGRLAEMKQAALAFAKPLAARAVAREILEFLGIN